MSTIVNNCWHLCEVIVTFGEIHINSFYCWTCLSDEEEKMRYNHKICELKESRRQSKYKQMGEDFESSCKASLLYSEQEKQ